MDASESVGSQDWRWRCAAALLILTSAAVHIAFLANDCPLDLAPDEAHYWDWSRHLDWSYYSKGPLVAYLIRAGCEIAGPLSRQVVGTDMLAVRLPAVICGALLLVSLYVLTVQVYGREGLATAVVAIALTLPPVAAGASLMTIDAPYTCCWGWALVLGYQAVFRNSAWAWPLAGLVVGLGILAKYTMVLWLPSLGLFLLTSSEYRRSIWRPRFGAMVGLAAACCLPILWWNVQNDWVTLKHVGGQAGLREAQSGVRWLGPFVYVGTQFALFLGYWFAVWAVAMIVHRPWRERDDGIRYLWWMSAPMFIVFLLFSLKTAEEPNWPVTAYLSGLVLGTGWLARQIESPALWYRRLTWLGIATTACIGLTLTVLVHRADLAQPILIRLSGPPTEQRPLPLRRFDPTCRLRGWQTLAAAVDRLREDLRYEGIEPQLAGASWTVPGELGFYCAGQPQVYSIGLALGDRHSQYDLWRPNPVLDPAQFLGQTFVFVGEVHPAIRAAFAQVEPTRTVTHAERGHAIAHWSVTICRNFRGFTVPPQSRW